MSCKRERERATLYPSYFLYQSILVSANRAGFVSWVIIIALYHLWNILLMRWQTRKNIKMKSILIFIELFVYEREKTYESIMVWFTKRLAAEQFEDYPLSRFFHSPYRTIECDSFCLKCHCFAPGDKVDCSLPKILDLCITLKKWRV